MLSPSTTAVLLTIRPARDRDRRALNDLAALDSAPPLSGDALVAESDGRPVAALELGTGRGARARHRARRGRPVRAVEVRRRPAARPRRAAAMSHRVTRVEDVPPVEEAVEGLRWHPVRHVLGVRAFGTNGYSARNAGDLVVEPHDEDEHEELYVVLHGAARFTVDGETFDAPQGTLVLVTPPSHRVAHATEPGTTILVFGAAPGQAFEPSEWEGRWLDEVGYR